MATSPDTVNQVRNILRKLDRSIDDARTRRLGSDEPLATPRQFDEGPTAPAPRETGEQELIGRAETPPADAADRPQRARRIERPRADFR